MNSDTSGGRHRFHAHSHGAAREDWQLLADHLRAVAERAEQLGSRLGIGRAARLAGLLHDLGKYTPEFQRRLEGSEERVDHSTAGAAEVLRLARDGRRDDALIAQLVAYAIAGHHAGLPDRQGDAGTLDSRLNEPHYAAPDEAWRQEISPELSALVPNLPWVRSASDTPQQKAIAKAKASFQMSIVGRMIFSCLVDADYRDTEAYYAKAEAREVDRTWPTLGEVLPALLGRYDEHMAGKPSGDSVVNRLRGEILGTIRANAAQGPGLFTLTVPTGGGKTLASLGFSLDHAQRHGLDRIIYAIPFAGAWIETAAGTAAAHLGGSLPSRERGSKREDERGSRLYVEVAPLAGAWIETPARVRYLLPATSLPSRERGSKLSAGRSLPTASWSSREIRSNKTSGAREPTRLGQSGEAAIALGRRLRLSVSAGLQRRRSLP